MLYRMLFLLLGLPLFSITPGAVVAASGQAVFFPIDSGQRGTEIINTFTSLVRVSGLGPPEVALQTNLSNAITYRSYLTVTNGYIPYVQVLFPTPNNTLFIVSYIPALSLLKQYIVLPAEQVSALLYFPMQMNVPSPGPPQLPQIFQAAAIPGTFPYFSVDPVERALDIVSAVTQLRALRTLIQTSQVWIQTTLTGPFLPNVNNTNTNGLLQNVIAISVSNSLIAIQFQPNNQGLIFTVYVAPEQVSQVIFIRDLSTPYK